jgi:hypothetical protein
LKLGFRIDDFLFRRLACHYAVLDVMGHKPQSLSGLLYSIVSGDCHPNIAKLKSRTLSDIETYSWYAPNLDTVKECLWHYRAAYEHVKAFVSRGDAPYTGPTHMQFRITKVMLPDTLLPDLVAHYYLMEYYGKKPQNLSDLIARIANAGSPAEWDDGVEVSRRQRKSTDIFNLTASTPPQPELIIKHKKYHGLDSHFLDDPARVVL